MALLIQPRTPLQILEKHALAAVDRDRLNLGSTNAYVIRVALRIRGIGNLPVAENVFIFWGRKVARGLSRLALAGNDTLKVSHFRPKTILKK